MGPILSQTKSCHAASDIAWPWSATKALAAASEIYVWLRYSSQRKLTWQRNYNVKPKELSEAAQRLSRAVSGKGLHSSTFRINVSALGVIGGALRGCLGVIWGVSEGVRGCIVCVSMSEMAQVELKSGRV